jgi:hypothetical protein
LIGGRRELNGTPACEPNLLSEHHSSSTLTRV